MDAGDRMAAKKYKSLSRKATTMATALHGMVDPLINQTLIMGAMRFRGKQQAIETQQLIDIPRITKRVITLDSFNILDYEIKFGWSRSDVEDLIDAMGIPDDFEIGEGSHAFAVSGIHCFLYTLFRLHSPSQRQTLDQDDWGYDYSVLSRIFNTVIDFIDNTHCFRLKRLPQVAHKFSLFNQKIKDKIRADYPQVRMPVDAESCALFCDGTRFRVSEI
jgi:hypothetical protein